ncbi:MAG: hypothetical protein MPJ08_02090 [Nitrosopumilus sp.]|nr:hypothetical protein [Nitrosopumilus sp.]
MGSWERHGMQKFLENLKNDALTASMVVLLGIIAISLILSIIYNTLIFDTVYDRIILGVIWAGIFLNLIILSKSGEQTKKRDKEASANLILKIVSMWEIEFTDLTNRIEEYGYREEDDHTLAKRLLGYLNMVAYMHEKNLIDIDDIKQAYGHQLKIIQYDENLQELINNDVDRYIQLRKLCDKI